MANRKWIWRLAAGLSLVWILGTYFLTESSDTFRLFLLAGVLPIITGWIVYWVITGFLDDNRRASSPPRIKLRWRK